MTRSQTLLHLPKLKLIYSTLAAAILFEAIVSSINSSNYLPDLTCMLLLYWTINLPHRINIFTAFLCGLLTDLSLGVPIGQYALVYSISTYIILRRQPQIVMFSLGMQSILVGLLLMCNLFVITLLRIALGASFIGWSFYLPPLFGAIIWPMLDKSMLWLCLSRSRQ